MPWNCMSYRYQKHAIQQDERIRHLEQELKAVRLEITKLKAVIGSSNIVKQAEVNDWIKPKNSKARGHTFSSHDPPQLQLRNRFSVLETQWKLSSRVKVCWSKRTGESTYM
jgi:hypothetical protein